MAKNVPEQPPPKRALSPLRAGMLAVLVISLLTSVGLRAYGRTHERRTTPAPAGAQGLVQGDTQAQPAAEEEPSGLERYLPYVTEGSFFGLIGFALGYASRKFVKLGLIVLAFFFVALQALVWTGTVSVDWGGLVAKLNALVFNLTEGETATQFLTRRIPSAGGMLAGYLIGFRRG